MGMFNRIQKSLQEIYDIDMDKKVEDYISDNELVETEFLSNKLIRNIETFSNFNPLRNGHLTVVFYGDGSTDMLVNFPEDVIYNNHFTPTNLSHVIEEISHFVFFNYVYNQQKRIPDKLEVELQGNIDKLLIMASTFVQEGLTSRVNDLLFLKGIENDSLYHEAAQYASLFWNLFSEDSSEQIEILRKLYRVQGEDKKTEFILNMANGEGHKILKKLKKTNGKNDEIYVTSARPNEYN